MPTTKEANKLNRVISDYLRHANRFTIQQAVEEVFPKARLVCAKELDADLRKWLRARFRTTLEANQPSLAEMVDERTRRYQQQAP
jgi:hypothetical protein